MKNRCAWVVGTVMIACAPAHGALVPVSRSSEVRVSATVGTQKRDTGQEYDPFVKYLA